MAASNAFQSIVLRESDVPGAKLVYESIKKHSNIQLQRWLECLGVRCTINRSHSTPCKKAEFEHLQIFPGHCLDFFLSVSGKICHSPIKNVKRQPTLIISFSQHSPFFGEQSKNPG